MILITSFRFGATVFLSVRLTEPPPKKSAMLTGVFFSVLASFLGVIFAFFGVGDFRKASNVVLRGFSSSDQSRIQYYNYNLVDLNLSFGKRGYFDCHNKFQHDQITIRVN